MITLYTDFGWHGPYVGQMKTVLNKLAPDHDIVDLMHDAPAFDPKAAGYLLAAMAPHLPEKGIQLCVIDPGVGSDRLPVCLHADGRWFVGPHNGLLELIRRRADQAALYRIDWRPETLSNSFHGRDLFAPVAAMLATGTDFPRSKLTDKDAIGPWLDWPDDLDEIIYIDDYGNCMTGLRASTMPEGAAIGYEATSLPNVRTFSDTDAGRLFWYENSQGLVEIAANRGHAARILKAGIGAKVRIQD
ncbi:SAM hydrolase/SAM-dependent halogenase family protein [Aestuariispira insulae]|uniref:SAM-dependent chlorinase/fluorinase n=1 Tax=Aestuariispira insulae TaxID=1461337 RepID=A0A3D9HXY3_9PROT|nr:SAM-dependent chlorinase/fluorinase [Aestuariispira insulae]RED54362.1 hypothetical protein DFP90_1011165 [Aestuariispira insulae]